MHAGSSVASFIADRVQQCGRLQKQIASDAGFDSANMITMIKQGQTKLPLDKVGPLAKAIGADPVQLLKMCLAEYCPHTWAEIEGYLDDALTSDERALIHAMRAHVGLPYVVCMAPGARKHFDALLSQLQAQPVAAH